MLKILLASLFAIVMLSGIAQAQSCSTWPAIYLTNGNTADASQVMANFLCAAPIVNPHFTGNVGIGTPLPAQALDVNGRISIDQKNFGGNAGLLIEGNTSSSNYPTIALTIHNSSSNDVVDGEIMGVITNSTAGSESMDISFSAGGPAQMIGVSTPPSERMHIQGSTGNVGIGTATPADLLDINGAAVFGPSGGERLSLETTGIGFNRRVATGAIYTPSAYAYQIEHTQSTTAASDNLAIQVYSPSGSGVTSAALAINGLGNVGIGTTTPAEALDTGSGFVKANGFTGRAGTGGATSHVFNINWTGSAAQLWIDSTNVGTLSTVSDRRLKQQIETMADNGLARLMKLRPVTFYWRNIDMFHDDRVLHQGFIADEVQTVIPSAVNNKKDQVDAKGHPVYQSLVPTEIVPVLTKAVQEQQSEIESLKTALNEKEAEIEALKSEQQAQIDTIKNAIATLKSEKIASLK